MANKPGLTKEAFDLRLRRLERRLELLRKIHNGEAALKAVWVRPFKVKVHRVKGHYRYIEAK